ncbi:Hypothetical protein NTJ_01139 [Nesidiocoris tenuis]|uniref:Uncharacterized protein n=1 Tax=Nesidiocoris tenuis TaxID=355587 RepID=A0ABN7A7S0_9HEMI|nr:Hypothetical protein NTJ_01139 [Nesidiocoris tenuis]
MLGFCDIQTTIQNCDFNSAIIMRLPEGRGPTTGVLLCHNYDSVISDHASYVTARRRQRRATTICPIPEPASGE